MNVEERTHTTRARERKKYGFAVRGFSGRFVGIKIVRYTSRPSGSLGCVEYLEFPSLECRYACFYKFCFFILLAQNNSKSCSKLDVFYINGKNVFLTILVVVEIEATSGRAVGIVV